MVDGSRAGNESTLKPPIYVSTGDEVAIPLGLQAATTTDQGIWRPVEGLAAERNTEYVRRLSHRTRLLLGGTICLTLQSCWRMEAVLHRRVHAMTPGMSARTPRRMPIALFKRGHPRGRVRRGHREDPGEA